MIKTELPGHPFSARIHADQQENAPLHRISPMSVAMQTAVQQIFLCDYHGRAGSIFMESKALELLSHILADLRCDGSCHRNNPAQARRASQQIRLARQTLMDAIVSPPSLSELAEHVGMSVTSLTRKFRNAYGVSVFELLRNERLEKARMLLEDGEMNVTEVAYAVGFSSPAHLTRLFFSRFKIHPGEFRRRFLSSR
jgi:transcriptional regulator GlxA family with amidase domain